MENDKSGVIEYLRSIGYVGNIYNKRDIEIEVHKCYSDALCNKHNINEIFNYICDDCMNESDGFVESDGFYGGTINNAIHWYYEDCNRYLTSDVMSMLDFLLCADIPEYPHIDGQQYEDYDLDIVKKVINKVTSLNDIGEELDEQLVSNIVRELINDEPTENELEKLLKEQEELNRKIEKLKSKIK